MKRSSFSLNIPLLLTLFRLIVSPILMPALLIWLLPSVDAQVTVALATLFLLLSATDFFDGYLARRLQQESMWGKLLDPLADKFLVFSTAVTLVWLHKLWLFWIILVIGRDMLVMGVREMALSAGFSVPVAAAGKLKTLTQLAYITVLLANPYLCFEQAPVLFSLEYGLLFFSVFMTIYSGFVYCRTFVKNLGNQ